MIADGPAKAGHTDTSARWLALRVYQAQPDGARAFRLRSLEGHASFGETRRSAKGANAVQASEDVGWPTNGGIDNIRYSPLAQINRENVSQLQVAWTYDSHDAFKASEMQSNPVVVDGVLYVTTPTLKVVAVDAETGQEIWKFDPSGGAAAGARFRHRGVTVHKDRVFVSAVAHARWMKTCAPIVVRRQRTSRISGHAPEAQRPVQHAGRGLRTC